MSQYPDTSRVFAQHFAAGTDVPSWLCDVEPVTPGSQRPRLYFAADVVVVGTLAAHWILPARHVGAPGPVNLIAVEDQHCAPGVSQMILGDRPIFWPLAPRTWEEGSGDGGGGSGPDPAPEPWRPSPALRPEPAT